MHIDEFKLKYEPVFVDLVEQKPKENASKVKLVLYYLSSYFFKFSKKDIQNKYNHRSFWWNEKDELIFMSDFLSNRDFVDNIDTTFRHNVNDGSHRNIYLLYNLTTKKIAVQGFLINKKKNISQFDNCVIEDIKKFSDEDFEYIFSSELIDYHTRDEQLNEALTDIEETFPINSFWEYGKYEKNIGCVTSVSRDDRCSVLSIKTYSLEKEKLTENIETFEINFRDKEKFLENNKFKRIEDFKMRRLIFKSRKNKVVDMKKKIEGLKP